MYADIARSVDNFATYAKKIGENGSIVWGIAGNTATREIIHAETLDEFISAMRLNLTYFEGSAAIVFDRTLADTWQVSVYQGEIVIEEVQSETFAVGVYRKPWNNFLGKHSGKQRDIELVAQRFCSLISEVWGMGHHYESISLEVK
jgi:hypothetical protein